MQHRYWCARCRGLNNESNQSNADQAAVAEVRCRACGAMVAYIESVPDPNEDNQPPTAAKPRQPPSREQWYDAGYAPGTYEKHFTGPEWLPCWSDPTYVSKKAKAPEQDLQDETDVDHTEVSSNGQ